MHVHFRLISDLKNTPHFPAIDSPGLKASLKSLKKNMVKSPKNERLPVKSPKKKVEIFNIDNYANKVFIP